MPMSYGQEEWPTDGEILYNLGLISGTGPGQLDEDKPIKREELIKILVLLKTGEDLESFKVGDRNSFSDVPQNHWAHDYIEVAKELGITSGIGGGEFGLGQNVTYQQAVTFLMRLLGQDVKYDFAVKEGEFRYNIVSKAGLEAETLLRAHVFDLVTDTIGSVPDGKDKPLIMASGRFTDEKISQFFGTLGDIAVSKIVDGTINELEEFSGFRNLDSAFLGDQEADYRAYTTKTYNKSDVLAFKYATKDLVEVPSYSERLIDGNKYVEEKFLLPKIDGVQMTTMLHSSEGTGVEMWRVQGIHKAADENIYLIEFVYQEYQSYLKGQAFIDLRNEDKARTLIIYDDYVSYTK